MLSRLLVLGLAVTAVFCLGDVEEVRDLSEKDLRELAEFAGSQIYGDSSSDSAPSLKILSIKKQVVAGINYFLTLEVTLPQNKVFTCDATIYAQPWKPSRELLKSNCPVMNTTRFYRDIENEVPVTDTVVQRVAKYAIEKINEKSSCFREARLESVKKALQTPDHYRVDMEVCNWPLLSRLNPRLRIPYPCGISTNIHECNAAVQTRNGHPVSFEGYHCSRCP